MDCKGSASFRADGGGDVSHTLVYSTHGQHSDGFRRLGGRPGLCRLHEPSRERATIQQGPANAGRSWHRCVRRALYDPGLRVCLLARPNQRWQGRVHLLEPDHAGSRRCRTVRCAECSGGSSRAPCDCQCSSEHTSLFFFGCEDGFTAGVGVACSGKACSSSSGATVPDAAYAGRECVQRFFCAVSRGKHSGGTCGLASAARSRSIRGATRLGPGDFRDACFSRASVSSCTRSSCQRSAGGFGIFVAVSASPGAIGFSSTGCYGSASADSARELCFHATAGIGSGTARTFVPDPAATGAASALFGDF
jgi:hypothetical protein